jgi:hypothetical protein
VAYALVEDIAASWPEYQRRTAATLEPIPTGLILHAAGPTEEGLRIIEVWESEHAWKRFRTERLAPALAPFTEHVRLQPRVRALQPQRLVLRPAIAAQVSDAADSPCERHLPQEGS